MSNELNEIAKELGISKDTAEKLVENPETLDRLRDLSNKLGGSKMLRAAEDTNYVGCGGNAYQCGKATMEESFEETKTRDENIENALEGVRKTLERSFAKK